MPKEVKRFKCEGVECRYLRASKATVARHEKTCWKVVENRTCLTCKHDGRIITTNPEGDEIVNERRKCLHPEVGKYHTTAMHVQPNTARKFDSPRINCAQWERK